MHCPVCGTNEDKVVDSRSSEGGRVIRRRRECLGCGRRFTTYERVEEAVKLAVVKRDGSRMPYDRQKLFTGLQKACYKRPVSVEQMQRLIEDVEDVLFQSFEKEVDSWEIGRLISERLRSLDQVAYVRYASVYKQFRDIEDLLNEVREVMDTTPVTDTPYQGRLF